MSHASGAATAPFVDEAKAAEYHEKGFLVYPGALTPEELDELRADATRMCRHEYGEVSGSEPPGPEESDEEVLQRHLCIHFPHKASDIMLKYVSHPAIAETLTRVIGPNVKCMQSMLFIKSAGMPGQAWHQDEFFIPTRDRSLTGGWIALDDATVDNGCLRVIPGSHKPGVIYPQQQKRDERFDCTGEAYNFPYSEEDEVPVEVKAGSIVFFNGYLLHRSLPNYRETGYRRVLVNHYMSAESFLPWFQCEGVHVPASIADFRDIVMVAGEDPYAWKGLEDANRPKLRPSGKGGCADGAEVQKAREAAQ